MRELSQQDNSPKSGSNDNKNLKKTTSQRQFYVCFCAKPYNSYSALYLHAKKKHDCSLNMKCLKKKRHEWSGNVKNIYYEFVQEEEMDDQQQQESLYMENKRKGSSSLSKNGTENAKDSNKKANSQPHHPTLDRIKQIFEQYLQQRKKEKFIKNRIQIVQAFHKYISKSFSEIIGDQAYKDLCKQNTINFIPYILNNFFQSYEERNIQTQKRIIKQLSKLSDWLYMRDYCQAIAVDQFSYQKFSNQARP